LIPQTFIGLFPAKKPNGLTPSIFGTKTISAKPFTD